MTEPRCECGHFKINHADRLDFCTIAGCDCVLYQGEPAQDRVGVTDTSAAEIMDAFAALRCSMTKEQESESISRVIAAVRADERLKGQEALTALLAAVKRLPMMFPEDLAQAVEQAE